MLPGKFLFYDQLRSIQRKRFPRPSSTKEFPVLKWPYKISSVIFPCYTEKILYFYKVRVNHMQCIEYDNRFYLIAHSVLMRINWTLIMYAMINFTIY